MDADHPQSTPRASLFEFDGELVHLRSFPGSEATITPDAWEAYQRLFPMVPQRGSITCRAILDRQTIHVRDIASEPGISAAVRNLGSKSQIALPLLRDGAAIGAVVLGSGEVGGFTDAQVALLQTFAEQAVIAITSAETYRELQARTAELAERNTAFAERIDHQAATIDVLKQMSASPADAQPVFDLICNQARALLGTHAVGLFEYDGILVHVRASSRSASLGGAARDAYDAG